ncbi:hypothetical protein GCM10023320_59980 [Pseudonocardia adelaidensis]|uniref:Uncharacterized protein n=1 Tax=Pseudonocardia adelaidensis TaxID=648754 RepID=A0ABP9NT23_9PSEU
MRTSIDWEKLSRGMPFAATSAMTGVSGTGPAPSSASGTGICSGSSPGPAASACTVRSRKMSRGVIRIPARRARPDTAIEVMLSPPSAKKSSSMPTRSSRSASANRPQSRSSRSVRGPRPETRLPKSGSGSAARSSLPFGVSGNASSATTIEGTMCSGRTCATRSRNASRSTDPTT